jgi:hypothetical protein
MPRQRRVARHTDAAPPAATRVTLNRMQAQVAAADRGEGCVAVVVPCREHSGRAAMVLMRCPTQSGCERCAAPLCTEPHTPVAPVPTLEQLAAQVEAADITHPSWPETRDALATAIETGAVDDPDTRRDLAARLRALPAADHYPEI